MIYKEIEGVLVMFTLTTGVTGLRELQSKTFDRDPCLSFHDRVGMAYMGRPFASYLCLRVDTERFDRLRGPVGLPTEISFLVSPGLS